MKTKFDLFDEVTINNTIGLPEGAEVGDVGNISTIFQRKDGIRYGVTFKNKYVYITPCGTTCHFVREVNLDGVTESDGLNETFEYEVGDIVELTEEGFKSLNEKERDLVSERALFTVVEIEISECSSVTVIVPTESDLSRKVYVCDDYGDKLRKVNSGAA